MNKKTMLSLAVIMFFIFLVTGCSSGKTQTQSKSTEIMKGLDETVINAEEKEKSSTAGNDDLMEMRHWKYAHSGLSGNQTTGQMSNNSINTPQTSQMYVSPPETAEQLGASYEKEIVTIRLLTEDEMNAIIHRLSVLGYLESTAVSEADLKEALKGYQADKQLAVSGVLDAYTLAALKEEI